MKSLRELFRRLPPGGKVAHEFRSFNLGMMGGASIPSVHQLATRLGFDVYLLDLPKSVRGRLETDTFAEAGYRIEINKNDDVQTRRWTVLHEIMHYFLHPRNDPFAPAQYRTAKDHYLDGNEAKAEWEANAFVEALMFGDGALKAAMSLYQNDESLLMKHFGVSLVTLRRAIRSI